MHRNFVELLPTFLFLCLSASTSFSQSDSAPPPLKSVTLYKHGIGYFERQGKVNGDQQVTFLFDAAQMNDVLKSLVVLDLGASQKRGKISSVTFDSTKPFDKRIEDFGIRLDGSNQSGLTSLLGQLKGARVEVRTGTPIVSATGTVVWIEKRAKSQGAERIETKELELVSSKDQERMRENLKALGKTDEEKLLVQRYVGKIAQGEDQLEKLRLEEKKLLEERSVLQRQLDERVRKLTVEHRLN